MSKYVKLNLGIRHSAAADYDAGLMPDGKSLSVELSGAKVLEIEDLACAITTGYTIDLASFTTVDYAIVQCKSTTYSCTVSSAPFGGTDVDVRTLTFSSDGNGAICVLPKLALGSDLVIIGLLGTSSAHVIVVGT